MNCLKKNVFTTFKCIVPVMRDNSHNGSSARCRSCTGDIYLPLIFLLLRKFSLTDIQLSDIFMEISVLTDV